jgi:hypothetical protein
MKELQKLTILFIVLLTCFNSKKPSKVTFSGYFYLKQLYSGPDPLASFQNSKTRMSLKFFTLNNKLLYYSNSDQEKNKVEGSIKIKQFINSKSDNLDSGKCCVNIEKKTFDAAKSASIVNDNPIMSIYKANYCIELRAQDLSFWRLCSDKQNIISQFHMKLIYNILKSNKKKNKNILSK